MSNSNDALHSLYVTLIDSKDGYDQAAENVEHPKLRSLFSKMSERRAEHAQEIQNFLREDKVDLDEDGSLLATAHRQFLKLKDAFTSGDDAILSEVIRGERFLLEKYDEAIRPMAGNSPAFQFVNEQYRSLKARIDELDATFDEIVKNNHPGE